jgi:hypothetical protein
VMQYPWERDWEPREADVPTGQVMSMIEESPDLCSARELLIRFRSESGANLPDTHAPITARSSCMAAGVPVIQMSRSVVLRLRTSTKSCV